MKIKVRPEDFVVTEVAAGVLSDKPAAFRVYRLEKTSWDTMDLASFVARRFGIPPSDIAFGGYKDRYGHTSQLVSIRNAAGLPDELVEANFTLRHEGYSAEKLSAGNIKGNRFELVMRDVPRPHEANYRRNLDELRAFGIPNYYDEQRFGSARHGKGYIGKALFLGEMETALRLYFTPSKHDQSREREFKTAVIERWGQWRSLLPLAPPKERAIVECLARPQGDRGFTQALNRIDRRLLVLMLHAYQSYLFNRLATLYLAERAAGLGYEAKVLPFKYGDLVLYRGMTEAAFATLKDLALPVPGYDTVAEDSMVERLLDRVLAEEGIGLEALRIRKLRVGDIHGETRRLIVVPEDFAEPLWAEDELYPGRLKIVLSFFLPKGSYATMVVKRVAYL